MESGLFRCENRRMEVPFIVDIDFLLHFDMKYNVDNEYEIINQDLNEADLKIQL